MTKIREESIKRGCIGVVSDILNRVCVSGKSRVRRNSTRWGFGSFKRVVNVQASTLKFSNIKARVRVRSLAHTI